MTKVSIIIATYNVEKTLEKALESIRNQSFQDWECIIIDGKSDDDTLDIIKEFAAKDERFYYISEPDKGIYDAFNKGWKMAKGEWVHYLGADDGLLFDGIANLLEGAEDFSVVSGHVYLMFKDGRLKLNISKGFGGCHQGKLVKRDLLIRFGGFNTAYSILADKDLFMRIKNQGVPIKNINTCVAYFSLDGVSQRFDTIWKRAKENFCIYKADENTRYPLWKTICIYVMSLLAMLKHKYL